MLSREENELLTRTGLGTPLGGVMRRYWIPALLSWELAEPDGPPVRLGLLGEKLVAFRDTHGRIGVLEEFCAHRGVSLWLGRNEEGGLRCVYHGWKYDVDGNCVDQMNEPQDFKSKVHMKSYPTVELGDIIWTYMGPPELQPPPPKFAWTQAPESHRHITKVIQECNWLQGLEGGIDQSHAAILHRALSTRATKTEIGISPTDPAVRGNAPRLEVERTDYGYRYFSIRPLGEEGTFIKARHFVMPFTQIRSVTSRSANCVRAPGHFWVPMDDENCMVWNWEHSIDIDKPLTDEERSLERQGNGPKHVDQKTFRSYRNKRNDWGIDRHMQKYETYSGIEGINNQDRATQESMGPIVDRTKEHLGPADQAIIVGRKVLLETIKTVQNGGTPPGTGTSYYNLLGMEGVLPNDNWREPALARMESGGVT